MFSKLGFDWLALDKMSPAQLQDLRRKIISIRNQAVVDAMKYRTDIEIAYRDWIYDWLDRLVQKLNAILKSKWWDEIAI